MKKIILPAIIILIVVIAAYIIYKKREQREENKDQKPLGVNHTEDKPDKKIFESLKEASVMPRNTKPVIGTLEDENKKTFAGRFANATEKVKPVLNTLFH